MGPANHRQRVDIVLQSQLENSQQCFPLVRQKVEARQKDVQALKMALEIWLHWDLKPTWRTLLRQDSCGQIKLGREHKTQEKHLDRDIESIGEIWRSICHLNSLKKWVNKGLNFQIQPFSTFNPIKEGCLVSEAYKSNFSPPELRPILTDNQSKCPSWGITHHQCLCLHSTVTHHGDFSCKTALDPGHLKPHFESIVWLSASNLQTSKQAKQSPSSLARRGIKFWECLSRTVLNAAAWMFLLYSNKNIIFDCQWSKQLQVGVEKTELWYTGTTT